MERKLKRVLALLMATCLALAVAGCSNKASDSENKTGDSTNSGAASVEATAVVDVPAAEDNQFTWWITATDDNGAYYTKYEENPVIQWLNNQYWDKTNHTLGNRENGEKLRFSFQAAISGAQQDNFNTMIATGEYPEIIDLSYAGSPLELYEDGVLMEITEYVEKYLTNYTAYLAEHPELKKFVVDTDKEGKDHYYAIYGFSDSDALPWEGHMYRRDWVVKYAVPTEYVWDWDSGYVKENGHPAVTPLASAVESGNLTGWKKNEVTAFTSSDGNDPRNTYSDNVVFPSGKTNPYTISDWEWMFEAFKLALADRGFAGDTNAYPYSLYYLGFVPTGELVSTFGGGNGAYYINPQGKVEYTGASAGMKTYVNAMNVWYNKSYLDTKFETRASDMFFNINENGYSQGKVGMWIGGSGVLADTIRATCTNAEDAKDAYAMPCALPINDVYGTDDQKYLLPDCLYQGTWLGLPVGYTTKCKDKDMEALFSYVNWMFSFDGLLLACGGLSEEQYKSMTFAPDLYAAQGADRGYDIQMDDAGVKHIVRKFPPYMTVSNATRAVRLSSGYSVNGNIKKGYVLEDGQDVIVINATALWNAYKSTGQTLDYAKMLSPSESNLYNKTNNYCQDLMAQSIPSMIKNGLGGWDTYAKKLAKFNTQKVVDILQPYVDK